MHKMDVRLKAKPINKERKLLKRQHLRDLVVLLVQPYLEEYWADGGGPEVV